MRMCMHKWVRPRLGAGVRATKTKTTWRAGRQSWNGCASRLVLWESQGGQEKQRDAVIKKDSRQKKSCNKGSHGESHWSAGPWPPFQRVLQGTASTHHLTMRQIGNWRQEMLFDLLHHRLADGWISFGGVAMATAPTPIRASGAALFFVLRSFDRLSRRLSRRLLSLRTILATPKNYFQPPVTPGPFLQIACASQTPRPIAHATPAPVLQLA